jgi:TRAP-type C4-dicarboxylate transport system permease small subunit
MTNFLRLYWAYGRLLRIFGLLAAYATFVMMVLVVVNVTGRYLFNAPVTGTLEITESLLVIIILMALALTQFHDGHIRVTILTRRMPPALGRLAAIFALILGAAFFAWCSYASWKFAYQSYTVNEAEWGSITFPLYPIKFIVFFGIILLAIQFVLDSIVEIVAPAARTHDASAEGH